MVTSVSWKLTLAFLSTERWVPGWAGVTLPSRMFPAVDAFRLPYQGPGWVQPLAKRLVDSAGVWAAALGRAASAFPLRSRQPFCSPDGSNLRPPLYAGAVLSFFPETNKTCFSILLGLKYLSPFFFFTGQEEGSCCRQRKETITGPNRSRSCATAAHSLGGRNIGPQTWNKTLSKCLWAAQEKHPPESYLIKRDL